MKEDYVFPEIYVEDGELESNNYLLLKDTGEKVEFSDNCNIENREVVCFAKVPYDNALELIVDVYNNRIKRSFITKTRDGRLLLVKSSVVPKIIDIQGWIVRILVQEGDIVKKWQRIAYVLTRKYETRTIKSPWEGIVTYIGYVFGEKPEHYVIVMVDKDDVKYIGRTK